MTPLRRRVPVNRLCRRPALRAIFIFMLLPSSAEILAQLSGGITLGGGYSDNVFGLSTATPASMQNAGFSLGWFSEDDSWAVGYSGDFLLVPTLPDRQFSIHSLSSSASLPIGQEEKSLLSLYASGTYRAGRDAYAVYDYSQGLVSALFKREVLPSVRMRAGYRAKYKHYADLPDLTHIEHYLTLGGNGAFETKTGLDLEAALGIKNYTGTGAVAAPVSAALSDNGGLSVDGNGPGGGGPGNGSGGGGNGNGGKGYGGGGATGYLENGGVPLLVSRESLAAQLLFSAALSQSIAEGTGLSVRYRQRWNLKDRGTALIGTWIGSAAEDDLVDDPYSYESNEGAIQLTRLLPWRVRLGAGATLQARKYFYGSSLDPEVPSAARSDLRTTAGVSLTKDLDTGWRLLTDMTVSFEYQFVRNQSNASPYDYSAHYGGIDLEIGMGF